MFYIIFIHYIYSKYNFRVNKIGDGYFILFFCILYIFWYMYVINAQTLQACSVKRTFTTSSSIECQQDLMY